MIKPFSPILCLAGDIGSPYSKITHEFIQYCNSNWDKILWIPGCHELSAKQNLRTVPIEDCHESMKDLCKGFSRVQYMYNSTWKAPSGHLFLGTPLWGRSQKNPFRIHSTQSIEGSTLQPFQLSDLVQKNYTWLDGHIGEAQDMNEKVVCITYTSPVSSIFKLNNKHTHTNSMRNNYMDLLRSPVCAWIVGDIVENEMYVHKNGYDTKTPLVVATNSLRDVTEPNYLPKRHMLL